MKQKAQWLSQVRTRSNTAEDTSAPRGSPAVFRTETAMVPDPGPAHHELELGLVGGQVVLDDVAGHRPVDRQQLVTGPEAGTGGGGGGRDDDHPRCRRHSRRRHHPRLSPPSVPPGVGEDAQSGR